MANLGSTELIIILAIVVVLFGAGRIGKIAGELGQAIREFRKGLSGDGKDGDDSGKKSEDGDTDG